MTYWTWAVRKEEWDHDLRDFLAWDVVWMPTDEQLNKAKSISLTSYLKQTTDQWCVPSCTAHSLCHIVTIQNIIEESTQNIYVDVDDQWINNQGKKKVCSGETWDYLERAVKTLHKNWVSGMVRWENFTFNIDWYAYESLKTFEFEKMLKLFAYRMRELNQPLYCAFKWNAQISKEISIGEWISIITLQAATYGHAVAMSAINFEERWVEFANSWNKNNNNKAGEKKISSFRISFDVFEKLIENGIRWWRYRFIIDQKNMIAKPLFIDFAKWQTQEATDAVARAKETWMIQWVPSELGPKLEPYRAMTRIEYIIAEYRRRWEEMKAAAINERYLKIKSFLEQAGIVALWWVITYWIDVLLPQIWQLAWQYFSPEIIGPIITLAWLWLRKYFTKKWYYGRSN